MSVLDKFLFDENAYAPEILFGPDAKVVQIYYGETLIWEGGEEEWQEYNDATCKYDWSDTSDRKFIWHIIKTIEGVEKNVDRSFSKGQGYLWRKPIDANSGDDYDSSTWTNDYAWAGLTNPLRENKFLLTDRTAFPPGRYRITVKSYSKYGDGTTAYPGNSTGMNNDPGILFVKPQADEIGECVFDLSKVDNRVVKWAVYYVDPSESRSINSNDYIDHYEWQMIETTTGAKNDPKTVTTAEADISGADAYPGTYKMHVYAYDAEGNKSGEFISDEIVIASSETFTLVTYPEDHGIEGLWFELTEPKTIKGFAIYSTKVDTSWTPTEQWIHRYDPDKSATYLAGKMQMLANPSVLKYKGITKTDAGTTKTGETFSKIEWALDGTDMSSLELAAGKYFIQFKVPYSWNWGRDGFVKSSNVAKNGKMGWAQSWGFPSTLNGYWQDNSGANPSELTETIMFELIQ